MSEPINGTPRPIGQPLQPKGKMMHPVKAVAIMSEGFIQTMKFLQNHGMPGDVMAEAMRIGETYGLVRRIDGINPNGTVFMQYINPYADMAQKHEAELAALAKDAEKGK